MKKMELIKKVNDLFNTIWSMEAYSENVFPLRLEKLLHDTKTAIMYEAWSEALKFVKNAEITLVTLNEIYEFADANSLISQVNNIACCLSIEEMNAKENKPAELIYNMYNQLLGSVSKETGEVTEVKLSHRNMVKVLYEGAKCYYDSERDFEKYFDSLNNCQKFELVREYFFEQFKKLGYEFEYIFDGEEENENEEEA